MGPGFRFDLHVHTEHSRDARGTVMNAARAAKAVGLHGFAVTDHNTVAGHRHIARAAHETGLAIIPGVEVSTTSGHVLVYGVTDAPETGLSLEQLTRWARDHGGVAVPAHPLRMLTGIGPTDLADAAATRLLRSVEGTNGRDRLLVRRNVQALLGKLDFATTGGSDAHGPQDIGVCWTVFDDPVSGVDDVVAAIREGRCRGEGGHAGRARLWRHRLGMAVGRP